MVWRQARWAKQRFPYGSEFSFDITGQEEVVVWNMYYGDEAAAKARPACITLRLLRIPYQDDHVLFFAFSLFRTRITLRLLLISYQDYHMLFFSSLI